MNPKGIPVFIINLKERTDRLFHIRNEFCNRPEFNLTIVSAYKHQIGAVGLWNTICHILKDLVNDDNEFIILCQDDHQFTNEYSNDLLSCCIIEAQKKGADVLAGGVSGFTNIIHTSSNLCWVEKFSGLQFTIIFRKFFQTILQADSVSYNAADYKMCELTDKKFFIYPFISVQRDFGYSDVTPMNNVNGHVEELFKKSHEKVQIIRRVTSYYEKKTRNINLIPFPSSVWEDITIPVYVINLPERKDRKTNIEKQFIGRKEFEVTLIDAYRHPIGAVGLWISICKIIELAIRNEDDVIVICEDDHEFTTHYNRKLFIGNLLQAYQLGCKLLCGGIGGFNLTLPITEGMFWIDSFWCTQFIVIYRNFYEQILRQPFSESDTADGKFSEMTSRKMVIHPFISVQHDFGYSDVTKWHDAVKGKVKSRFMDADERLRKYREIYSIYAEKKRR